MKTIPFPLYRLACTACMFAAVSCATKPPPEPAADTMMVRKAIALTGDSLTRSNKASCQLKKYIDLASSYQERIDSKAVVILDHWK